MKKILLFFAIFYALVFPLYGEDVLDILKLIREKLNHVNTYKADFTLEINIPDNKMLMEGKVTFKREDKLRVEMSIPNVFSANQLTISDGNTLWQYLPSLKIASKVDLAYLKGKFGDFYYSYSKEDISKPFKDIEENKIKYLGEEEIAGREYFLFEAEPKESAVKDIPFTKLKIWIDKETGLEKKTILYNSKGEEVLKRNYENIMVNLPILDKEFEFSPPEGVEVMDMTEEAERFIEQEKKKEIQPASPSPLQERSL